MSPPPVPLTPGRTQEARDARSAPLPSQPVRRVGAWLAQDPACEEDKRRLWATTRDERVRAMRAGELSLRLCLHWAGRAPEEVPLLDGESELIAIGTPELADADEHNAQRRRVTESLLRCRRQEDAGERPGCGH